MTEETAIDLDKSASQVEQELLEETLNELANQRVQDPAETYAQVYSMYMPRFNSLMDGLNSKGKVRVIKFIMQYPFNEKEYRAVNQFEQEAMSIGHAILEAKYSMIMFEMLKNVGLAGTVGQGENTNG